MARVLAAAALLAAALGPVPAAGAEETRLTGLRMSATDERSRLVFELGAPVRHQVFTLSDPQRVVIDIEDVDLVESLPSAAPGSSLIRRIRSAPRDGNDLRVVLDLARAGRPKSFLLEPAAQYGHRLVVDVIAPGTATAEAGAGQPGAGSPRDLIIAIDPGHGGKDPGAIGRRGTHEKDIVLDIGRRLHDLLERTPGYKPVMTRERDVYLSLRERIARARAARADMFISLHADAFRDGRARGSSVYALSLNGASSEAAKWLADRENSADLIGGVTLDDKDEMVASVLLDLSQTATIESSLNVGEHVLAEIGDVNDLHKHSVQQAGFVVLKSPDIPSILVETAFISNPQEEAELRRDSHQQALARAIRDGIQRYFERKAPPGTRIYARNRASSG
ncbi:MAG: N-acetylmuramoyl-L-alanine amidase [Halofilum sp. (in: g-proteobacteria)]|nr:N-acetylmuramoyl-L-alanine amidase [Halofilum sp. (in: g-proteobacteria)]